MWNFAKWVESVCERKSSVSVWRIWKDFKICEVRQKWKSIGPPYGSVNLSRLEGSQWVRMGSEKLWNVKFCKVGGKSLWKKELSKCMTNLKGNEILPSSSKVKVHRTSLWPSNLPRLTLPLRVPIGKWRVGENFKIAKSMESLSERKNQVSVWRIWKEIRFWQVGQKSKVHRTSLWPSNLGRLMPHRGSYGKWKVGENFLW